MKFIPLAWAALRRNRTESVLTLLALSVAFALFGTMSTVRAAYQLVTSLLGSVFPALRAGRLTPVEALRVD